MDVKAKGRVGVNLDGFRTSVVYVVQRPVWLHIDIFVLFSVWNICIQELPNLLTIKTLNVVILKVTTWQS
jgi:hypothetical protein